MVPRTWFSGEWAPGYVPRKWSKGGRPQEDGSQEVGNWAPGRPSPGNNPQEEVTTQKVVPRKVILRRVVPRKHGSVTRRRTTVPSKSSRCPT